MKPVVLVIKFLFIILLGLVFVPTADAQTSCPVTPTSGNSVITSFSVPETNTYTIWTRLRAASSTNNSLWLQVDNGCAINVGDSTSITPDTFTWVNYQDGNSSTVISLPLNQGSHTVKLIEREGGVGVDRLLVTTNIACTPAGTGDNCPVPTNTPFPTNTPIVINATPTTVQVPPTSTPIPTPTLTPIPTATPVPTTTPVPPTATPQVVANGLLGVYFNNADFTGTSLMKIDNTVNFNWGNNQPAPGIASDTFSVRWTGYVVPRYTQSYTFYTRTDDGVRLWVNNQQIINHWVNQSAKEVSGRINLTAGVKYPIRIDYFENKGKAVAELRWASTSQAKEIIPASQLIRP